MLRTPPTLGRQEHIKKAIEDASFFICELHQSTKLIAHTSILSSSSFTFYVNE